jgi:hypothetical protein
MPNRRVDFEERIWLLHKISDYMLMRYFSGKHLTAQS